MNKELSRQVSDAMLDVSAKLNASIGLVQEHTDDKAFNAYRLKIGTIMADIYSEILRPIYQEHPDLKPPELD
ncbi:MAG TPA: hypothetical protein VG839_05380 [Asticcacaulis sp.]|nr:hypothetical protein [Asticcacaulis sp.]